MRYLLDVSTLLALLLKNHVHHARVKEWQRGKLLSICPITELGFLRVATQTANISILEARKTLSGWLAQNKPKFIPCDLRALDGISSPDGIQTTDYYLASLADKHGLRWATLDKQSEHPSAFVVP